MTGPLSFQSSLICDDNYHQYVVKLVNVLAKVPEVN